MGDARASLPTRRCASIHIQRSSGWVESSALKGTSGTFFESLKITLRCMFLLSGVAVHSYPAKVVNFPIKMPLGPCTHGSTATKNPASFPAGEGGKERGEKYRATG